MVRYFFYNLICPHCKDWTLAIEEFNSKLPYRNKIIPVSVTNSVVMDTVDKSIIEKIKISGTPTFYIGDFGEKPKCIVGTSSRYWVYGFLNGFLKDEFEYE